MDYGNLAKQFIQDTNLEPQEQAAIRLFANWLDLQVVGDGLTVWDTTLKYEDGKITIK